MNFIKKWYCEFKVWLFGPDPKELKDPVQEASHRLYNEVMQFQQVLKRKVRQDPMRGLGELMVGEEDSDRGPAGRP